MIKLFLLVFCALFYIELYSQESEPLFFNSNTCVSISPNGKLLLAIKLYREGDSENFLSTDIVNIQSSKVIKSLNGYRAINWLNDSVAILLRNNNLYKYNFYIDHNEELALKSNLLFNKKIDLYPMSKIFLIGNNGIVISEKYDDSIVLNYFIDTSYFQKTIKLGQLKRSASKDIMIDSYDFSPNSNNIIVHLLEDKRKHIIVILNIKDDKIIYFKKKIKSGMGVYDLKFQNNGQYFSFYNRFNSKFCINLYSLREKKYYSVKFTKSNVDFLNIFFNKNMNNILINVFPEKHKIDLTKAFSKDLNDVFEEINMASIWYLKFPR